MVKEKVPAVAPIKVVFLAYPGVSLLDLGGPLEALCAASMHPAMANRSPVYETKVASIDGGAIMTADGVALVTEPLSALENIAIDTVIVPGAFGVDDVVADPRLIAWLRRRSPECRRTCSVCAGSFALAEAGLLAGKRATTHWLHCNQLSQEHDNILVEHNAVFVRDGALWSSAGVTTGIDLALALIEEDVGRAVAMHVARVLVVYLKRSGGQSQFSTLLEAQMASNDDRFEPLDSWITEHLTENLRVERLAEMAGMSPRNFARVYLKQRGLTPAKAVRAIRLEAARRRLEETRERIPEIAQACGFADESALRMAFAENLGLSPRSYRDRFAIEASVGKKRSPFDYRGVI